MTYKPPFARMNQIKSKAEPKPVEESLEEEHPRSVDEALEEADEEVLVEADPEPSVEEEAEEVEEDDPEPSVEEVEEDDPEPSVEDARPDMSMTRKKLNEMAEALGIDSPDRFPNKGAVIEAIEDHQV